LTETNKKSKNSGSLGLFGSTDSKADNNFKYSMSGGGKSVSSLFGNTGNSFAKNSNKDGSNPFSLGGNK